MRGFFTGPTEACDEPVIYMDNLTVDDPLILAVIKRVHREDLLHEALGHANLYRRALIDTPPAPVAAPAALVALMSEAIPSLEATCLGSVTSAPPLPHPGPLPRRGPCFSHPSRKKLQR